MPLPLQPASRSLSVVHWIERFIFFHGKRHPAEMGEAEIGQFLSALAVEQGVSAATQNQALNAPRFLYRQVPNRNPGWIDNVVRAKRSRRLPVVSRKHEGKASLDALEGEHWLYTGLVSASRSVCGCGSRTSI